MWEESYPKYIVPEVYVNCHECVDDSKDVEAYSPSLVIRALILASIPASRAAFLIPNVFTQVRMRTSASATKTRARLDIDSEQNQF